MTIVKKKKKSNFARVFFVVVGSYWDLQISLLSSFTSRFSETGKGGGRKPSLESKKNWDLLVLAQYNVRRIVGTVKLRYAYYVLY